MISNTDWYRIFLHAAESSNMTKAAQSLHMTQPSVSYAIKQIEEALGVSLFDRLSKGIRLTPEGQALYLEVKQAFEGLDSAERNIKKLKELREGRLRIGANGAIVKDFILPVLDRFHARYSDIRIQLSQVQTGLILERLKRGALDFGYVYLPLPDEELEIVASYPSPYCAVVGAALADWSQQPLPAERLNELPLLMLSPDSTTRSFIEGWFRLQGVEAKPDFELNSLEMLVEFAERGYGASFLPRTFVEPRLKSGSLIELPTLVPLPDRHVGIAMRKNASPSLAAAAFLEMLRS